MSQARDELRRASASGTSPPAALADEAAAQFEMFLESNELELAWDALAAICDETAAPRAVWEKLLLAAGLMSLGEQAHMAARRLCSAFSETVAKLEKTLAAEQKRQARRRKYGTH